MKGILLFLVLLSPTVLAQKVVPQEIIPSLPSALTAINANFNQLFNAGYQTAPDVATTVAAATGPIAASVAAANSLIATKADNSTVVSALQGKVPGSRIITINGTSLDLSQDRAFTINTGGAATYAGRALLIFDGNSITQGRGAREASSPDDFAAGPYPSQTRSVLVSQFSSAAFTTKNFGVSGQRLTNMADDVATQIDVLFDPAGFDRNVIVVGGGSNDIADEGVSAQTALDRYIAYCKGRRAKGFLVVAQTIYPRTTNLPAISAAEFETRRQTFNTYVRANYLQFADVLADVANLPGINFPDGTHPDAAGYTLMGNYIATKLAPLLVTGFNPQSIAFLLSGATAGSGSGGTPTPSGSGTVTTGVVLLLRGQGANNSTSITDDSGHVISALGNAKISTGQAKFGTSSIYLDGSPGTYLRSPTSTDWNFGTADFTMEMWVYKTASGTGYPGLFCRGDGDNNMWTLSFPGASARADLFVSHGGTNYAGQGLSVSVDTPLNAWTHLALVSQAGIRKFYQNGNLAGTASTNESLETNNTNSPFNIGGFPALGNPSVDVFVGYLHARITKAALYTANFTPPASF